MRLSICLLSDLSYRIGYQLASCSWKVEEIWREGVKYLKWVSLNRVLYWNALTKAWHITYARTYASNIHFSNPASVLQNPTMETYQIWLWRKKMIHLLNENDPSFECAPKCNIRIFCFILLIHKGSYRDVYQEFQPSYDTFRGWCQGLFRP